MAIVAMAALSAAACSGGPHSSRPVAQPGQLTVQKLDAFAQCMRGHGVPDFYFTRSPSRSSLISSNLTYIKLGQWAAQVAPGPQLRPALQACGHLLGLPGQPPQVTAAQLRSLVKAAACMRAHGFPAFPDPAAQDGQLIQTPLPASVNTSSPQFQAAQQTCHAKT
jgi:hypothetical protein